MTIGVLALQGNFREHVEKFRELGVEAVEVRRSAELHTLDALVLPGGESTTVAILEHSEASFGERTGLSASTGIFDSIRDCALSGMPLWGTCMGAILLSKEIEGSSQGRLNLMNIAVRRNAFGPQRFSSEVPIPIPVLGAEPFPGIFIRAPLITRAATNVEILGKLSEGIVMARENHLLATVFHPEISNDLRVHDYFLGMVEKFK